MDRRLKAGLLSVLALGSGIGLTLYANSLLTLDAFARFRTQEDRPDPVSIRLQDFDIRHWTGGQLTTFAHVDHMDIGRNQTFYELFGVTKGRYSGSKEPFDFEASHATWNGSQHMLQGYQDVHVKNARYDLHGAGFMYQPELKLLTVEGDVKGKLGKVDINVHGLTYDETKHWVKMGPSSAQAADSDEGDDKQHVWHITGGASEGDDEGIVRTGVNVRATDGLVIVKSPHYSHNTKTDILTLDGPVRYWSAKADAIADHAVVYRKQKRVVLSGHVTMVLKAKDHQVLDEKVVVEPFVVLKPDDVGKDKPLPPSIERVATSVAQSTLPASKTASSPNGTAPTDGQLSAVAQGSGLKHTNPLKVGPAILPGKAVQNVAESAEQKKQLDDELRSDESVRKYPATIYAENVDYYYGKGERHAIITGSPQSQQELPGGRWRRVWAHHALYNGQKETLVLLPPNTELEVRVKTSVGDDFKTNMYQVSTQEGNKAWKSGDSEGDFVSEDEESNEAARKAGEKDKPEKSGKQAIPPVKPPGPGPGPSSGPGSGPGSNAPGNGPGQPR